MPRLSTHGAARRKIARDGVDITVRHRSKVDASSRGHGYEPGLEESVRAYVEFTSSSADLDDLFGASLDVDAEFHVLRDDITVDELTEGGGDDASRVEYNGRQYAVERVEDQGQSVLTLEVVFD